MEFLSQLPNMSAEIKLITVIFLVGVYLVLYASWHFWGWIVTLPSGVITSILGLFLRIVFSKFGFVVASMLLGSYIYYVSTGIIIPKIVVEWVLGPLWNL